MSVTLVLVFSLTTHCAFLSLETLGNDKKINRNHLTVMFTTRNEHFHLLTTDGRTQIVSIVQTQGSCMIIVQTQGSCNTHIVIIVQTQGPCKIIVQIQGSCKTHIYIKVQIQVSCDIVQTKRSCIFNLTSTGKGDIGKLLFYLYNTWWSSCRVV